MRVFKQQYKSRNGKTKKSTKWYVELKDHNETMRRLPGFTDKKATQEFGRRLENLVAVRTLGDTPGPELSRWLETVNRNGELPQQHRHCVSVTGRSVPRDGGVRMFN